MTNIIIIDDDINILKQVLFILESSGYQIESLAEPKFLFQMLEETPADLILMDINMPGIDGISLLKQLKDHPVFHSIPVVMLTADDDPNTLDKCFELGAIDFINKPIHEVILKARTLAVIKHLQLESQLRHTQKMKALATMSGGLAHDINNILFAILGNAELLQAHLSDDPKGQEYIEEVIRSSQRAKNVVLQLLAFVSAKEGPLIPAQILPMLKKAVNMLRTSLPANIEIQEKFNPVCPRILVDNTRIYQAIVNIGINAKEAMAENGGTMTITLEPITFEDPPSYCLELSPGNYLRLSIQDTGCGMNHDVQERLFEPFFTTKGMGGIDTGTPSREGTGLGLYVVFNIVQQLKGIITMESEPEQGTTFHLYFPTVEEEAIKPVEEKPSERPVSMDVDPQKLFRILVAEDETQLTQLYERILEMNGYQVTVCDNGKQALETYRETPDQFDLVLTDQEMPQMTGTQLSQELLKISPDLPVILATGYSAQISEKNYTDFGIQKYLTKPIMMKALLQAIREIGGKN